MNWNDYKQAVDALSFSADFQRRTEDLVRQRAKTEKECMIMKRKGMVRIAAAAAVTAMLTVSVYAASRWLSPAQVADLHGDPMLAQAFESGDAIRIDQSVTTEGLCVTLAGLVSGENLSRWTSEADQARTYAVMILESMNGSALSSEDFPLNEYTLTPLVAGFTPRAVNNWTLHAGVSSMDQDGVVYYLLDVQSVEMFADHTVYMAFYQGSLPNRDSFTMAEDGTISFAADLEGPKALFTLPLDKSKADPAAVERFMDESGFERDWFTTVLPEDDTARTAGEAENGREIELVSAPDETELRSLDELDWLTTDDIEG